MTEKQDSECKICKNIPFTKIENNNIPIEVKTFEFIIKKTKNPNFYMFTDRYNSKIIETHHVEPKNDDSYNGKCGNCLWWGGNRYCYLRNINTSSHEHCQNQMQ